MIDAVDVMNAVVGADLNGKCKSTIAFFVEECLPDGSSKVLDEFMVEKPIVQISQFSDNEDNQYYTIEFRYKSRRDEDLKQQWQFLERFAKRLETVEDPEKTPILVVSFLPISLKGKFTLHAVAALPASILKMEYASDNTCSIKMVFFKDHVHCLSHDESLVDPRAIEAEVNREIDNELASKYPVENSTVTN